MALKLCVRFYCEKLNIEMKMVIRIGLFDVNLLKIYDLILLLHRNRIEGETNRHCDSHSSLNFISQMLSTDKLTVFSSE